LAEIEFDFCVTFTSVPPDILDYPTSPDMVVREGANVTLQCAATGFPLPKITWRREDKGKITIEEHLSKFSPRKLT